jgi:hypothetical protein
VKCTDSHGCGGERATAAPALTLPQRNHIIILYDSQPYSAHLTRLCRERRGRAGEGEDGRTRDGPYRARARRFRVKPTRGGISTVPYVRAEGVLDTPHRHCDGTTQSVRYGASVRERTEPTRNAKPACRKAANPVAIHPRTTI